MMIRSKGGKRLQMKASPEKLHNDVISFGHPGPFALLLLVSLYRLLLYYNKGRYMGLWASRAYFPMCIKGNLGMIAVRPALNGHQSRLFIYAPSSFHPRPDLLSFCIIQLLYTHKYLYSPALELHQFVPIMCISSEPLPGTPKGYPT